MEWCGVTTDVFVASVSSWSFWEALLGRAADVRPDAQTAEWKLLHRPEVVVRVRVVPERAGTSRLGLGVSDLEAARAELAERVGPIPPPTVKPGVIAIAELRDPDGNVVALWQDLLGSRPA
jgi:predicted enzyme related to lactoylglutathione lyase